MSLALDWDGTCTVADSLVAAIGRFGDPTVFHAGHASFGDSLAAEVSTIRADEDDVAAWATAEVRLRPGFHALVAAHAPVIVSSGLRQLIEPVLARERITVELRCNDADPSPQGWQLRFRDTRICKVCGDRCKRGTLPVGRPLVYVGDGISDRCAALAADRIFARSWLADHLEEIGVPFERFETLHDVAAALS